MAQIGDPPWGGTVDPSKTTWPTSVTVRSNRGQRDAHRLRDFMDTLGVVDEETWRAVAVAYLATWDRSEL